MVQVALTPVRKKPVNLKRTRVAPKYKHTVRAKTSRRPYSFRKRIYASKFRSGFIRKRFQYRRRFRRWY